MSKLLQGSQLTTIHQHRCDDHWNPPWQKPGPGGPINVAGDNPDRLARAGRTEQRLALRAGIVLAAADGHPNARIAASLGVCEDTARNGRHRWCAAPGVSSLGDAKRCGRPAVFTAVQVAQVKPWLHPTGGQRVALSKCRARNWPCRPSAAGSARASRPRQCAGGLSEDALKPWQFQS